jgi:type II secretory pathway pseudopilin PulG
MKSSTSRILALALCCGIAACSNDASESASVGKPKNPAHTQSASGRNTAGKQSGAGVHTASVVPLEAAKKPGSRAKAGLEAEDLAVAESRGLLRWLPHDALVVLRVPHVELLGELSSRTGLASFLQGPLAAAALSAPESPLSKLQETLQAQAPELDQLIELWPELKGEFVAGVTHFTPDMKAKAPPVTVALAFSAETHADKIQELLDAYFGRLSESDAREIERVNGGWGFAGRLPEGQFEIRRQGHVYTALWGTTSLDAGMPLPPEKRPVAESFAASPVVLATPNLDVRKQGVVEFYVHSAPVWEMVQSLAPADVQDVLQGLGLYEIRGTSFALGLGEKGVCEAFTWCSPERSDIVSRVCVGRRANRELARWIPADATTAGLYAMNLPAIFTALAGSLPDKEAKEMTQGLAGLKAQTGIDIETDVIQNFGPSFAMVSRGDPLAMMNGFSGMCFVIETHDAARTKRVLDFVASTLPPNMKVKPTRVADVEVQAIDMRTLGAALATIAWCQVDGALLIATDNKMLERCLVAGRTEGVKQPDLAAALASEDVVGAGLCAAVGDLPKTLSVVRKTDAGFEVASKDGSGALGGSSVAVLPIVASIAIPKLMSARLQANDSAALATLRNISSAQAQTQASGIIDVDGDGSGEYGFFPEMAGAAPIRGSKETMNPPVLSSAFGKTTGGKVERSGYTFQIWLPSSRDDGAVCESKYPKGTDVDADGAEVQFTVYAWPSNPGNTGSRVYCLRNHLMYECQDARQQYADASSGPAWDAVWPKREGVDPESGKAFVGRDGLTWKLVE